MNESCENTNSCLNRREFLVKAGILAGGLALTVSGLSNVFAQEADSITVVIDAKSKLNKVGGSQTFKTKSGKIVIIRTGESEYKAFQAKCPHKGGPVKYDAAKNQLSCGWHDSIFDMEGKTLSGPSKKPLNVFMAESGDKSVKIKLS